MRIRFLGGAGTVTGSRFLVESARARVLVDCGLFQGVKALRRRNWQPLGVSPREIDAVVLSHAHIDHSGYVPLLVRNGFAGAVHATPPTCALCEILLPDSGHLHEEDARYANRKGFSRHQPALPLYTEQEARHALSRLRELEPGARLEVGDLEIELRRAGHILGAASVRVSDGTKSVLFSGDLGRTDDLLMPPPEPPDASATIVMESTYGDRDHPEADPIDAIAEVLRRTLARRGTLLMPSFAVGRAQTLLLCLHRIFAREPRLRVPVAVNSPMATSVTQLYERFVDWHRLSAADCAQVCDVAEFVRGVEASRELVARRGPQVVISASGMATGGRVLHHLRALAPDPRHTILLPGFQAPGTRGASLAAGADEIKIHGEYVRVRAEVVQLGLLSAHADRGELLDWLAKAPRVPERVLLVHGEPAAADALRRRVRERIGVEPGIPQSGDVVEL